MRMISRRLSLAGLMLVVSAGMAAAVPITGLNGGIQSVSTTATLNSVNGGCIGVGAAACTVDGDITGNLGTFVEFFITGGETFTYVLDGPYDVSQFLLWNDRGAADSGINAFTLVFHGSGGPTMFFGTGLANQGNNPIPEIFNVGLHTGVSSIDLIIATGHHANTQFREVEFDGIRSVPEPMTVSLLLMGAIGVRQRAASTEVTPVPFVAKSSSMARARACARKLKLKL